MRRNLEVTLHNPRRGVVIPSLEVDPRWSSVYILSAWYQKLLLTYGDQNVESIKLTKEVIPVVVFCSPS